MRNATLMTVGIVAALGAAFAMPALSDGPANYSNSSAYNLHDDDHAEYVERQTDAYYGEDAPTRDELARDQRFGYEDGVGLRTAQNTMPRDADHRVVMTTAEESIDVQARRMPNGAPVAVRGMVTKISGKSMVIERAGTRIHARLPGMVNDEIQRGDDVTVYGRVSNRGNELAVRSEAVLLMTGLDRGHLFLSPSKLESVNKLNASVSRGEARNALDYYRYNFTPL
ncbi:MAG: hypothetical protein AB7I36_09300 [Rhodospirillaceae bacterium]